MKNIVQSIICNEYEKKFHRAEPGRAMKVVFSLGNDWDVEYGYRHLEIILYDFGCNYVAVFGRTNWNVIRKEWSDGDYLQAGREYVKGETPLVLYGYHDSCWREAVGSVLRDFEQRIVSIDTLFDGGWAKSITVDADLSKVMNGTIRSTPGYGGEGKRAKLYDLDFKFPKEK